MSLEFTLEIFVTTPLLQVLTSLKKSQLQQIATHFKLEFNLSTRKADISRLITEHLVDEELVSEEEVEEPPSTAIDSSVVELKRLEFEDRA